MAKPVARRKILHILPSFGPGGAERMATHLLMALKQRSNYDVAAVSLYDPVGTDLEEMLRRSEIPVWYLGKQPGFAPLVLRRISRVIEEFRPDVIHTHLSVLRYTLLPTMMCGVKGRVHTVHSIAEKEVDALGRHLHRLAFRAGVLPVAIASEVGASMRRVYGATEYVTVPNCVPVNVYRTPSVPRALWRSREGLSDEEFIFVSIATLSKPKNHELMVRAFANVISRHDGVRLLLVGQGNQRECLEKLVLELGVQDRVHFLGLRTDIPDILAASDAFILTSDWEGNPLSVMEAMAAGRPVISTSVGGVPELVVDSRSGILVRQGDRASISQAMLDLASDRDRCATLGEFGARLAGSRFDVNIMAAAYEAVYETVMSR